MNTLSIGGTVTGIPSLGTGGDDALRETAFAEYETAVTKKTSLTGALGATTYRFNTHEHEFNGKGVGVEGGFKFYPWGVLNKIHIGFSIGIWRISWRQTDKSYYDANGDFDYVEKPGPTGGSWAHDYHIEAGYKFAIGERFLVDPFFRVGGLLVHAENGFPEGGFGLRACLLW